MKKNMRIARNLRRNPGSRQERGFTLIEMMVVIGVMAILMTIAAGAWGRLRSDNRVEAAAEEIYSLMSSARLKALATGRDEYVGLDFANDRVASTMWGGVFDPVAGTWSAATVWRSDPSVDLVSSTNAGVANVGVTMKNFKFTSRGTGTSASLMVLSNGGGGRRFLLTVNGVTGRVRMSQM